MVIHLLSNATATMFVSSFTQDSFILHECGRTDRNGRLESWNVRFVKRKRRLD